MNNAHVQPNGMYHYHGLPIGLIQTQKKPDDLIHVGMYEKVSLNQVIN